MKKQLIKTAIELFTKTLDKKSKFYQQDITDFKNRIQSASAQQLEQSINNMSYMASKKSDIDFERETRKLDKAGMFNIGNMKPINALD